jgi:hypothetical protein
MSGWARREKNEQKVRFAIFPLPACAGEENTRHCEKRSDEAIQNGAAALDCFAALAMTGTSILILAARFLFAPESCQATARKPPQINKGGGAPRGA